MLPTEALWTILFLNSNNATKHFFIDSPVYDSESHIWSLHHFLVSTRNISSLSVASLIVMCFQCTCFHTDNCFVFFNVVFCLFTCVNCIHWVLCDSGLSMRSVKNSKHNQHNCVSPVWDKGTIFITQSECSQQITSDYLKLMHQQCGGSILQI